RSGRTGRAGSKGVSALVVPPAEFKKAQRLLQGAKVVAEWGKAPSAEEVSAKDDMRMAEHPALTTLLDDMSIAEDLLAHFGAQQIAAAFVQLWREGRPPPEDVSDSPAPSAAAPRAPRDFGESVWFSLSVGHTGRAEARWLLPKICDAGGITRDAIGAIRVRENESYVQIATAEAPRFGDFLEIEPGLTLRRMKGEPVLDRNPERRAHPGPSKPARKHEAAPRPRTEAPMARLIEPARPPKPPAPAAAEPAEAKTPRVKTRWTTAQKAEKGKGAGKPARFKAAAGDRPGGKFKGKRPAPPRAGGDAPPRRPKGRG
ncbi:MAG: DbpA RNA binding domain-containing protein, partial [Albidovulum sp.]